MITISDNILKFFSLNLHQGIIGSLLESSGLSLFVFSVLSIVKETDVTIVFMNAIFVVPVVWQLCRSCKELFTEDEMRPECGSEKLIRKHRRKHIKNIVLSLLACILQVAGLVGIIFLVSDWVIQFLICTDIATFSNYVEMSIPSPPGNFRP